MKKYGSVELEASMKTLIFLILLILEVVADRETNEDKKVGVRKLVYLN